MLDQSVEAWLAELASEAPAPGGGAAAAMNAAVGAALVAMVCNLTIGKQRYAASEALMTEALGQAQDLRVRAIGLVEEDTRAFEAVTAAYKLPKDSEANKQARSEAIQAALIGAAEVPLRTAATAVEIIALARRILDGANVNVISDVAVAAVSARAALEAAAINVEINLAAMTDPARCGLLRRELDTHLVAAGAVDPIVATVRERIAG